MRAFEEADLGAVLELLVADEEQQLGRRSRIGMADLREWLAIVDLATGTWLQEDGSGPIAAGWTGIWGGVALAVGATHPRAKGAGLGAQLVDRSEAWAVERKVPRIHQVALGADAAAASLFETRAYRKARRFFEMAIHNDSPPAVLPAAAIETFREEDARAFHAALDEAFADHWEHHPEPFEVWWERQRGNGDFDASLWFLIREGEQIAGAVRNVPNRNGGGYVAALGVRRLWRGRGYGRALLLHTFAEFHARGVPRVTLDVDSENATGATKLYESVGMEVELENVVYEKVL